MNADNSNDDEIDVKNDIFNYKGYFVENEEEEEEPKYYEFGAHFPYQDLYNALSILKEKQLKEEKGKEIEKIFHINKKKITNRERNNTKNKNKKIENNLNDIMKNFKFKGRSRNVGIDNEDENQNDLTYVPKISFKNNLSIKKSEKNQGKSLNAYRTNYTRSNYLKIYRNIKDRININNYNKSNKKINFSNKHKKNRLNQIKIGKYSDKYILTRNTNQNNINKPNNILVINKTLNQENKNINNIYDMNLQKSFQTQIKEMKKSNKKELKLDSIIYNSNSNKKGIIRKKSNRNRKKSKITNKNNVNNNLNKNDSNNNIKNDVDKGNIGNSFSCNTKNNLKKLNQKIVSTPLEYLLNSYKSKNSKYSPEISQNIFGALKSGNIKSNSSHKVNNKNKSKEVKISLDKYMPVKLNKHLDVFESKGIISISIDNNNKNNYFNNKKSEKNKLNKKNNLMTQSSFNNNKTFPNISTDYLDKNSKNINNKKDSENSKENIHYLLNKKEKSRNKINNFLSNNISSNNYKENNNINTINNNNDHIKINKTQQNNPYLRDKNQEIIKNKTFINLKKNKNNSKNKKILIGFPSSSTKKNGHLSQLGNNSLFGYYSTSFIGKNNKKTKINNSYFNKLLINKSKQRLSLAKGCIIKSKNKERIFSNNKKKNIFTTSNDININNNNQGTQNNNMPKITKLKNNIKNNSVIIKNNVLDKNKELKKYQSLINKKDNNINIRININNNNIIYNRIVNNKGNNSIQNNKINLDKNIINVEAQKINKSPSFNKTKNMPKFLNKKITNNIKNTINQNANNNNNYKKDDKVKFINVQFPKAKFINIFNNN